MRAAMLVVCVTALPVLASAALAGTAVAILQAATQVQEQTLTLLPKVIAVGVLAVAGGPFALGLCAALFHDAVAAIPALVAGGP